MSSIKAPQRTVQVGNISIANHLPFVLIAGPCVMQSEQHAMEMADALSKISKKLDIPLIYKTSFDKANRTSMKGYRGIGLEQSLEVFAKIKETYHCPVITDVHEADQCAVLAQVVDVLQIPAFLCRQTDLLIAAGKSGCAINVKKGQFLAPWDVPNIVKKIDETGNHKVMLCERGASFGYNTLVNDMRSLPIMASTGCPVIFDATHSVQQPGGAGSSTSGDRRFVPVLARAAIAVGVAGVFMESHEDPDSAPSDGPNMVHLKDLPAILACLKEFDAVAKKNYYEI
jgi:2-dehydro-3-deoxyphosphooctonate aldolase (KDO 8-P synthase)